MLLAEARIGAELKAAQDAGQLATQESGRPVSVPAGNTSPATLPEIGISRKQAMNAKRLAEVGEPAIRAEVKRANDEERERNARIVAARAAGETVRQVAEREGVSPMTVSRASVPNRQSAVSVQQAAAPFSTPSADLHSPEKGSGQGAKQYAGNSAELPMATVQPTPSPQQGGARTKPNSSPSIPTGGMKAAVMTQLWLPSPSCLLGRTHASTSWAATTLAFPCAMAPAGRHHLPPVPSAQSSEFA